MGVWYFAYGRNISFFRLCERIGGYPALSCRGILPGYRLKFNKTPGPRPGTGYSNITPAAKEYVEGVVYLLAKRNMSCLDRYEGVPEHYVRQNIIVWNIDRHRWVKAVAYIAARTDDSLEPPREYLEEILEAARTIGLNPEWIARLEEFRRKAL